MNFTKKILVSMLGAGLILTSCSSDEPFATGEGGEKQVTFTLNVPDAVGTRSNGAAGSDKGGVSNNPNATIYYTLELYYNGVKEGESMTVTSKEKQVTFNPTVILGRNYNVVAYANLVGEEKGLDEIIVATGINNEKNDAYFANVPTKFTKSDLSEDITLKRPFGKLRLVATDYDADKTAITNIKVTYASAHQNKFNALSAAGENVFGVFASDVDTSGAYTARHDATYYADATGEKTIFVDYIAAPAEGETSVKFDIEVTYENNANEKFTRTFAQDIPVKRNALTTLKGNFFTANATINVEVEEDFDSEKTIMSTDTISFLVDQVTLINPIVDEYDNFRIDGFNYDVITASVSIKNGQSHPIYNTYNNEIRLYANNEISLKTPEGITIEKIVFTIPPGLGKGRERLAPITASLGNVTLDKTTWSLEWVGSASEVTFIVGARSDWGEVKERAGRLVFSAMEVTISNNVIVSL